MRRAPEAESRSGVDQSGEHPLLEARGLRKYFPVYGGAVLKRAVGWIRAVDGVSFAIKSGETLGLVGESGCGKTTTANLVLLLDRPTEGGVYFQGFAAQSIHQYRGAQLRRFRQSVQAVFQDPWSSLDPRSRAESIVAEPLRVLGKLSGPEIKERVKELFTAVGLNPSMTQLYPHEFSGGQRQRIAIARALSVQPRLVVLDEPVASLDVSIQAQVMNVLKDLQEAYQMSYLLIGHHLGSIRYLSHRVAVMYLGQIVEEASAGEIFDRPLHPYTQALMSAALPAKPSQRRQEIVLSGEVPSASNPPPGCRFHTRCPFATARCSIEEPTYKMVAAEHKVACHLH